MDENQPIPQSTNSGHTELLQAQAKLWCHAFRYMESMVLKCAIDLGIPNTIHSNGGSVLLPELLATLPIAASKKPFLSRVMRFLTMSGIFTEGTSVDGTTSVYQLTAASQLLVDSITINNLLPFTKGLISQYNFRSFLCLGEWFQNDGDTTPFMMAHGIDIWDAINRDTRLMMNFNAALASDSNFLVEILIRNYTEAFMSMRSLVDVGGGDGAMAKVIAKAFPHVKCLVLDLPHVVHGIPTDDLVEYIAGDMMDFVPPANVVLLKSVLHDWSDEDCIRILKRCREAILNGEGKVIIIDTVIGSLSEEILEAQLSMDICMMALTTGKEREEKEWHKIFQKAGFTEYKILPILGIRSLIEVYP
ncbi:hypothetical protein E2562_039489 [Oryza meyeriana var. granulata]|uniref:O-methyltransferase domain-containing protein n=1 Tax=Oryza meyeriana var. granulata TaxID=110450 RepID=A0A6G1F2A4_9ORYZ|nr:hypothetical protein E2562_039489 [Oryza meyeriana var. granulata]